MDTWQLEWPFQWVIDGDERGTGWAVLHGPVVTARQQEQFARLRRAACRLVGMSSYMSFPRGDAADPLDYESVCEAWAHCFREPQRYLRSEIPRALISESDFTDPKRVDPSNLLRTPGCATHAYFLFVCGTEAYQRERKNWPLAARCIPRLCGQLGLHAVVIGTPGRGLGAGDGVTFVPTLPSRELLAMIAGARFLFVPNQLDASPRVIAEALCLDVPVLVNRSILGGWKYVTPFTGAFFADEEDVVDAAACCATPRLAPRAWFCANHGPHHAGRRLLGLLRQVDGELSADAELRLWEGAEPAGVR